MPASVNVSCVQTEDRPGDEFKAKRSNLFRISNLELSFKLSSLLRGERCHASAFASVPSDFSKCQYRFLKKERNGRK
jgi:hypothetical protein